MAQELFYTSVPRGLMPGSQGFCTVAATRGMTPVAVEKLESLTGYKPLFAPNDPNAGLNPVGYFHYRITISGRPAHVLGRIGAAPNDYSGRTNKFAHFVVLDPSELPACGPAALLLDPNFLQASWDAPPEWIDEPKRVPNYDQPAGYCRQWQQMTGDAGWAGALVQSFETTPHQSIYLGFEPGDDQLVLTLFAEAMALMTPEERWTVGFSTYPSNLSPGINCHWRGAVNGFADVKSLQRTGSLVWPLSTQLGEAEDGLLTRAAREGKAPSRDKRRSAPPPVPAPRSNFPPSAGSGGRPPAAPNAESPKRLSDLNYSAVEARHDEPDEVEMIEEEAPRPRSRPAPRRESDYDRPTKKGGLGAFWGLVIGVLVALFGVLLMEAALQSGLAQKIGIAKGPAPDTSKSDQQIAKLEADLEAARKAKRDADAEYAKVSDGRQTANTQLAELQKEKVNLETKLIQAVRDKAAAEAAEKKAREELQRLADEAKRNDPPVAPKKNDPPEPKEVVKKEPKKEEPKKEERKEPVISGKPRALSNLLPTRPQVKEFGEALDFPATSIKLHPDYKDGKYKTKSGDELRVVTHGENLDVYFNQVPNHAVRLYLARPGEGGNPELKLSVTDALGDRYRDFTSLFRKLAFVVSDGRRSQIVYFPLPRESAEDPIGLEFDKRARKEDYNSIYSYDDLLRQQLFTQESGLLDKLIDPALADRLRITVCKVKLPPALERLESIPIAKPAAKLASFSNDVKKDAERLRDRPDYLLDYDIDIDPKSLKWIGRLRLSGPGRNYRSYPDLFKRPEGGVITPDEVNQLKPRVPTFKLDGDPYVRELEISLALSDSDGKGINGTEAEVLIPVIRVLRLGGSGGKEPTMTEDRKGNGPQGVPIPTKVNGGIASPIKD